MPPDDPFGCFVGAPVVLSGQPGSLTVAIKDNIDVAGLPTGAGLGRPGRVAERDALLVHRIRAAGFTVIGKTRMDEIALGATGENAHHGRTENPRCPGRSPGGSSSGSAAAVAAGYCTAALGTDTLGSVRIPAAYCGLVGLKPTRGLLPMAGIVALSWTLDHAGIIAGSVETTARVLAALAGPVPDKSDGPLRIGVPDVLDTMEMDPATWRIFQQTLRRLEAQGWPVLPCHVSAWDPSATRRAGLLLLEAEGAVAHEALISADDPAMSPAIRRLLLFGRDCGTGRLVRALRLLREVADGLQRVLRDHDLLALPTVPAPAFNWVDGAPANQADLAAVANFGGYPAISVPIGAVPDGRPVGLQLIGQSGADWRLLDAARIVEALR